MKQKVFFGENGVLWVCGQFTLLFSWVPCLLEGGFNCCVLLCLPGMLSSVWGKEGLCRRVQLTSLEEWQFAHAITLL